MRAPSPLCCLLLLLATTVAGVGCEDEDGTGVILPPIEFRNSFPRDGARLNEAGEDTVVLDLSIDFTRGTVTDEVRFSLFPPAPRAGRLVRSITGRNWAWLDVALAETDSTYYWLVDGTEILVPKVIRLVVAGSQSASGFRGTVRSSNPQQAPVGGTIVFALDPGAGFNPFDPLTFFDRSPLAAATVDSLGDADERDYRFGYMPVRQPYHVVAIVDTSGDARYDPTQDWWGYRVEGQNTDPEIIRSAIELPGGEGTFTYRTDVDLVLRRPGARPIDP